MKTGTKFSSSLNEHYNYVVKRESEDKFWYAPIDKKTGIELSIEIPEPKTFARTSLRHKTYKIIS